MAARRLLPAGVVAALLFTAAHSAAVPAPLRAIAGLSGLSAVQSFRSLAPPAVVSATKHPRAAAQNTCTTESWASYGHDSARTGASGGCIAGPLTTTWRYVPTGSISFVDNAVADASGAYLEFAVSDAPYAGTPTVDRVDTTGARTWRFTATFSDGNPVDTDLGTWPSLTFGHLAVNDDGMRWVNPADGSNVTGANTTVNNDGNDTWGQTTPDVSGMAYDINTLHADGFPLHVVGRNSGGSRVWTIDNATATSCRDDSADSNGSIALDAGSLFFAPNVRVYDGDPSQLPHSSGLYSFNAGTGALNWYQATRPTGAISAGSGMVYLVESTGLVARSESTGAVVWSATVPGLGHQAPVLAGGLVVVAGSAGVSAFDASTGALAWQTAMTGAAASSLTPPGRGPCHNNNLSTPPLSFIPSTTIAAALGTGTVVVTAGNAVHVLALATGADTSDTVVTQAVGSLRNPVIVGHSLYVVDGPVGATGGGLLLLASA